MEKLTGFGVILPRTSACRSRYPFMSLSKQKLGASECVRKTWPTVRFHRVFNRPRNLEEIRSREAEPGMRSAP